MDRLFLDANVLFSAAYRENCGLLELWNLEGVRLLSSSYAIAEAGRNLPTAAQRERLTHLVDALEIVQTLPVLHLTTLPPKDQPILAAAIGARATHLITGDCKHFGEFFGKKIAGVQVMPPAAYLRTRTRR